MPSAAEQTQEILQLFDLLRSGEVMRDPDTFMQRWQSAMSGNVQSQQTPQPPRPAAQTTDVPPFIGNTEFPYRPDSAAYPADTPTPRSNPAQASYSRAPDNAEPGPSYEPSRTNPPAAITTPDNEQLRQLSDQRRREQGQQPVSQADRLRAEQQPPLYPDNESPSDVQRQQNRPGSDPNVTQQHQNENNPYTPQTFAPPPKPDNE